MKTIKIRNKTYTIEQDDYILHNGVCYQLIKPSRSLYPIVIMLTKKAVKELDFDSLEKIDVSKAGGGTLIKWRLKQP